MKARGSLDLLGPSTKQAIVRIAAGEDPLRTGRFGTTKRRGHARDAGRDCVRPGVAMTCLSMPSCSRVS